MPGIPRAGPWMLAGGMAFAVLTCVADVLLPVGIAVPALYAIPVILSLWLPARVHTLAIAATSTVLTLFGFFASPNGEPFIGLSNRILTILLIWGVAFVIVLRKRAEERIKLLEGLIPICAACKKIRDDDGHWDVIESYIQQHTEAAFTHGLCPECLEHYYGSAAESSG